jgi:hypothetical protein
MTTVSGGVAVIATHLVQTDRRALSEAWYSALHFASGNTAAKRPVRRSNMLAQTVTANIVRVRSSSAHASGFRGRIPAAGEGATPRAGEVERRRPVTAVEKRIERAVGRLTARRPLPAAHTLDVAGGRVRLLVHDDGRVTRIVALCNHALREPVERALASARFTLAARGMAAGAP